MVQGLAEDNLLPTRVQAVNTVVDSMNVRLGFGTRPTVKAA